MKLTFEGQSMLEIVTAMEYVVADYRQLYRQSRVASVEKPVNTPMNTSVEKPVETLADIFKNKPVVEKPVKARSPKQLENDAKLRERALAKKAAGLKVGDKMGDPMVPPIPPPPATAESLGLAPDEVAKNRARTLADLQEAYANGFQKEVFELLSRFGNGAKTFRELPPEAFVPIREAIDNGALT